MTVAGRPTRGVPRPAVSRAAVVLVLIGSAIFVIARTTGSGWLMVLLSGLIGALAVSVLLPPLALRVARLEVRSGRDATAGRSLTVTVSVPVRARNLRARLVEPAGSWFACDGPAEGEIIAVPAHRGVLREVAVDVRSAWPLGLVPWRRRLHLPLARPIEVGPAPIDTEVTPPGARGNGRPWPDRAAGAARGPAGRRRRADGAAGAADGPADGRPGPRGPPGARALTARCLLQDTRLPSLG